MYQEVFDSGLYTETFMYLHRFTGNLFILTLPFLYLPPPPRSCKFVPVLKVRLFIVDYSLEAVIFQLLHGFTIALVVVYSLSKRRRRERHSADLPFSPENLCPRGISKSERSSRKQIIKKNNLQSLHIHKWCRVLTRS